MAKIEADVLEAHDAIVAVCVAVPELPFRTAGAIVAALHQSGVFLVRAVGAETPKVVGFKGGPNADTWVCQHDGDIEACAEGAHDQ